MLRSNTAGKQAVLIGFVVGGVSFFLACRAAPNADEKPVTHHAAIGDVVSPSNPATCAPTLKAGLNIQSAAKISKGDFLRVAGEEARSAGLPGPIFLDSSNHVKVLDNSSSLQVRVRIVDSTFDGVLNDSQKDCWVQAEAINNGQVQPDTGMDKAHKYSNELPPSTVIRTQADFDQSDFCKRYTCKDGTQYTGLGDIAVYSYKTSVEHLGVDVTVQVSTSTVNNFSVVFYERDQADFDVISTLVRSSNQTRKHDKTISFIQSDIETALSAPKSIIDGEFRISAGKASNPWVSLDRISSVKH